jgi:hypothetical protein
MESHDDVAAGGTTLLQTHKQSGSAGVSVRHAVKMTAVGRPVTPLGAIFLQLAQDWLQANIRDWFQANIHDWFQPIWSVAMGLLCPNLRHNALAGRNDGKNMLKAFPTGQQCWSFSRRTRLR